MYRKLFICTLVFIFSCYKTNLIASELKNEETLLKKIITPAPPIQDHSEYKDKDKTLEQMIGEPSAKVRYPVYNFFKDLLFGKKTPSEQESRKEIFNYICNDLYTKRFLIGSPIDELNEIEKDKLYITLAFCQYTYFFPYEHSGILIEYYNQKEKKVEAVFYELTFKSRWDAFNYARGYKDSFKVFEKDKESIVASFCMHPNLETPDQVRWYPYKTFTADYDENTLNWLKELSKKDHFPYSFFGTKKVNENDEILGEHNCMSFAIEVLKKLNVFGSITLGDFLSYSQTYPITKWSIFYPSHSSIAKNWFWLPESLKRLVDDENMINKKGTKRSRETNDNYHHEATQSEFKRPKSDLNARVKVEGKIKRKIRKAFKKSQKDDINKKTK